MSKRIIKLIDQDHRLVATAQVTDEGEYFGGTIDLQGAPTYLRSLFDEFEEIVNGQMFSFLDEIQDKIAALPIKAVFADGTEVSIKDLQVYPSAGEVSFKLVGVPAKAEI